MQDSRVVIAFGGIKGVHRGQVFVYNMDYFLLHNYILDLYTKFIATRFLNEQRTTVLPSWIYKCKFWYRTTGIAYISEKYLSKFLSLYLYFSTGNCPGSRWEVRFNNRYMMFDIRRFGNARQQFSIKRLWTWNNVKDDLKHDKYIDTCVSTR